VGVWVETTAGVTYRWGGREVDWSSSMIYIQVA
jgi:hypothetical protein